MGNSAIYQLRKCSAIHLMRVQGGSEIKRLRVARFALHAHDEAPSEGGVLADMGWAPFEAKDSKLTKPQDKTA